MSIELIKQVHKTLSASSIVSQNRSTILQRKIVRLRQLTSLRVRSDRTRIRVVPIAYKSPSSANR